MAKWLELLRVGKFRDRHNIDRDITQANIDSIAANYKEDVTNAPVLVGHPGKAVVPSCGVFKAVKAVGDRLFGLPGEIVPEFSELVRKGAFPDLSVGLNSAMNALTHVAFLSAESPAVSGLAPVCELSADTFDETIVAVDVTEITKEAMPEFASADDGELKWRISDIGTILRNIKNWLIGKEGQEAADGLIAEWLLDGLKRELPTDIAPAFSASAKAALESSVAAKDLIIIDLRNKQTEIAGKEAEFSATLEGVKAQLAAEQVKTVSLIETVGEYEKKVRLAEFSTFVDGLGDRVTPDQRPLIIDMLETVHENTPAEFSAASGVLSPVEKYKKELLLRPVVVSTGKLPDPEFSGSTDNDPVAKGMRVRAFIDEQKKQGTVVSYEEALKKV